MPDPNFNKDDAIIVISNTARGGLTKKAELFDQALATLIASDAYNMADSKVTFDTEKMYFGYDLNEFQRLFGDIRDIIMDSQSAVLTERTLNNSVFNTLDVHYTPSPHPPGGAAASSVSNYKGKIDALKGGRDIDNKEEPDSPAPPM